MIRDVCLGAVLVLLFCGAGCAPYDSVKETSEGRETEKQLNAEERLFFDYPNSEAYEPQTTTKPGFESVEWNNTQTVGIDTLVISVSENMSLSASDFREYMDEPGNAECDSFETETLKSAQLGVYAVIAWATDCSVLGLNNLSIQLVIEGPTKLHHIRKLWRSSVMEEDYEDWKQKILSAYVCSYDLSLGECVRFSP